MQQTKNMKISDIHLKYLIEDEIVFVSLENILYSGVPINDEGDDLETADNNIYSEDGKLL